MSLTSLLGLKNGGVAAVVGCGGKTSLIGVLAEENAHKRVLISTTTKIYPPEGVNCLPDLAACLTHIPQQGVQCMGILDEASGKLSGLPENALADIAKQYDLVLLEADGSRGLPMKGWRSGEPAVPPFCTHTIGVASIGALGLRVSERNVLREQLFRRLTGTGCGDTVSAETLERMICGGEGMFRNGVGELHIVVNQAEDEGSKQQSRDLLEMVCAGHPGRFAGLIYGSARQNVWHTYNGG